MIIFKFLGQDKSIQRLMSFIKSRRRTIIKHLDRASVPPIYLFRKEKATRARAPKALSSSKKAPTVAIDSYISWILPICYRRTNVSSV
jgi:hypothetical protein